MKSGIYLIRNTVTEKVYVGQSLNIKNRLYVHKAYLRNSNHPNEHLQRAFSKYGEDKFVFQVLEFCGAESLNELEKHWIDKFNSINPDFGYNKKEAGSHGGHSEETREKMRVNGKGKGLGKKMPEEVRRKISESHKGMKHSEESREKMRAAQDYKRKPKVDKSERVAWNKGKTLSEEHRARLSEAKVGKALSEETRAKLSEAIRLAWAKRKGSLNSSVPEL